MSRKYWLLLAAIALPPLFAFGWFTGQRLRSHDDVSATSKDMSVVAEPTVAPHAAAVASASGVAVGVRPATPVQNVDAPSPRTITDTQATAVARAQARVPGAAEASLLGPVGVRAGVLDALRAERGFESLLDNLARDSDSDTLEMTNLFGTRLQGTLAADKRFTLQRISCGARICAAVATASASDPERFGELVVADSPGPKVYAVMPYMLPQPDAAGRFEYRVVFTIDPKVAGFELPERF